MWHAHLSRDFTGGTPVPLLQTDPLTLQLFRCLGFLIWGFFRHSCEQKKASPEPIARPAGTHVPQVSQQTNFSDFCFGAEAACWKWRTVLKNRSEEHTSELQSHVNLVCRLLLEKKKKKKKIRKIHTIYSIS